MKTILNNLEKYCPEYDVAEKVLYLKGNIPVKVFMWLRLMIKMYKLEVKDIRVNW